MTAEIRTVAEDEFQAWVDTMHTGFLDHAAPLEAEFRRAGADLTRTLGAFDGRRVVGTFRSFATQLTVPGGGEIAASGVTNVAVAATHRRRGLLSSMMAVDLRASADRGEPVAILIASEFRIYGRYGYGAATDHVTFTVDTRSAGLRRPAPGTVELVDAPAMRRVAPSIYEHHRRATPGAIGRTERWWDAALDILTVPGGSRPATFLAVCRDVAGEPTGVLRYHVDGTWEGRRPTATLVVDELLAADPVAAARLWQYAFDVDWVITVKAENRSPDEILPWLLADQRAALQSQRADFLWLRVLDAPAALAARRYLTPGRLVVEVSDPAGFANGRFTLDGGPDGASCRRTRAAADLTLGAEALGAAYLGGTTIRTLAEAGLVDECRAGALETADAMFRSAVPPWCATWF